MSRHRYSKSQRGRAQNSADSCLRSPGWSGRSWPRCCTTAPRQASPLRQSSSVGEVDLPKVVFGQTKKLRSYPFTCNTKTLESYTRRVASSKSKCGADGTKRIDRVQASVN